MSRRWPTALLTAPDVPETEPSEPVGLSLVYSPTSVMRLLDCSRDSVDRLIADGELTAARMPRLGVRITAASVAAFIARQTNEERPR